ncbi:aminotransferase-like domain-containing protein [Pseudonocardia humida]|uniref:PLP-dependent aminotransferase family protein n=1 Tax=Pseudonocardia humida TaxID=2800819 RepID=A0ABT1A901_9PSEU|nr:PLP-dependent aminotransferase family protein [Pseudonocardia humida]MCO1659149.1 PLP-dependent aminotransferase family protein [Pseudonocardia humida]
MDDFRRLADAVVEDIGAGRLRPGDRLPTQRRFARDRGVAVSTASRVYGELVRRGVVVGEVGRGTFVRAGGGDPAPVPTEPVTSAVDLELNFPILPGQAEQLLGAVRGLLRADALDVGLRAVGVTGTAAARAAAVGVLSVPGWSPDPDGVVFAGNGRQAVAAAVSALVGPGGRIAVEALTYPVVRGIAARLGVDLVPVAVDAEGMRPDALAACGPVGAVYLQPTLHNPLGTTMSPRRRAEIAAVLDELDLPAVEDRVNAFLRPDPPPLAVWAPRRTVVVDSLSKRVAPGLSLGYLVAPPPLVARVAAAVRGGGWAATAFAVEVATRWSADGAVAGIERDKRADAAARQRLVADRLAGFTVRADPAAYHCWWELPAPWRAETFVAAAARRGVAVTPAAAFAVGASHAPNAVRLALGSPTTAALDTALATLAALAATDPHDTGVE